MGVTWIKGNRLIVTGERGLQLLLVLEQIAYLVMGRRVIRLEAEHLSMDLHGPIRFACARGNFCH